MEKGLEIIPFVPGSMTSDVSETGTDRNQYMEVINLEEVKKGKWRSVRGYQNLFISYSTVDTDNFESTTESWAAGAGSAARSQDYAYSGTWSLRFISAGTDDYVRKLFTAVSGKLYRCTMWVKNVTPQYANPVVRFGSAPGGSDLASVTVSKTTNWQHVSVLVTAVNTTLYVEIHTPDQDSRIYLDLVGVFVNNLDIRAATEVYNDLNGDRFILFQDGTDLKRIDYDEGDGNGYENETPATLTLPSGVTIGSDAVVKFHQHLDVVRISGASEPLWYGYIDRTLFPDAWEELGLHSFETDTESWTGSNAAISRYDCDDDPDGSGMWGAPEKQYGLKVAQTANTGGARRSYTVESGATVRVLLFAFRATGTGDLQVKIGSAAGGSDYETLSSGTNGSWIMLESSSLVMTGTALHLELVPSAGAANDTAYFDFILVEQNAKIALEGWFLEKAGIQSLEFNVIDMNTVTTIWSGDAPPGAALFGKTFMKFDKGQFSLITPADVDHGALVYAWQSTDLDYELVSMEIFQAEGFLFELEGSALKTSLSTRRLTHLGIAVGITELTFAVNEKAIPFFVVEDADVTEDSEPVKYARAELDYATSQPNRISFDPSNSSELYNANDMLIQRGARITLRNKHGVITTVVTEADFIQGYFEIGHPVYSTGTATLLSTNTPGELDIVGISLERKWTYDPARGYAKWFGVDRNVLVNDYYEYSGIPAGTENISPDYDAFAVASGRAFVNSLEDEEEDIVRYSPVDQPDVFPDTFLVPVDIGNSDYIRNLVERNGRIVILKSSSLSQIQYAGQSWQEDIALSMRGLHAARGVMVMDDILYYMEQDDVYLFSGGDPVPFLAKSLMQAFYKSHIDEDSFIALDKLDNRILLVLDGTALAYDIHRNQWHVREMDIDPAGSFLMADSRLVLFNSEKFVVLNHDGSSWDETIRAAFRTGIYDGGDPGIWKKAKRLEIFARSSEDIHVTVSDPGRKADGEADFEATVTPDAAEIRKTGMRPKYRFRTLEIMLETGASTDLEFEMRKMELGIRRR